MSTNTVFMFVVISFYHCVSLWTFCLRKRLNKAKQKILSTFPPYGNSAEIFGPGYMSPAVLCWWNTKQRDPFLKSKFRDESVRLLAPRQTETIREICWRHGWGECLLSYSKSVWARRLGDLRADDFALKRDVLIPFAFPRVWCLPGVWWYSCAGTHPNVLVIAKNHFLWRKFILVWQVKWNAAIKAFLDTYWARNTDTLTGKVVEMWSHFYWAGCSQPFLVFEANVQTYTNAFYWKHVEDSLLAHPQIRGANRQTH